MDWLPVSYFLSYTVSSNVSDMNVILLLHVYDSCMMSFVRQMNQHNDVFFWRDGHVDRCWLSGLWLFSSTMTIHRVIHTHTLLQSSCRSANEMAIYLIVVHYTWSGRCARECYLNCKSICSNLLCGILNDTIDLGNGWLLCKAQVSI